MNDEIMREAIAKMEEYVPHAIDVLESIIDDKSVDAKTRVRASSTLINYEKKLRLMQKRKGGEELSLKGNI